MDDPVDNAAYITAFTTLEGYLWCEVRGEIHSSIAPDHRPSHDGHEFWDIYQDGNLCESQDHHKVFTTGIDEE